MNWQRLRLKWMDLFHRNRLQQELDEEITAHLNIEIQQRTAQGDLPETARTKALRVLGSIDHIKENTRDAWTAAWLESLMQDIRFGVRMLRRNPGFTIIAVLTLSLGIGANMAIVSVIKKVLLEPLPYPQADRIVQFESVWDNSPTIPDISIPKFMTFREQTEVFQDAALYWAFGEGANLTGGDHPEQVAARHVSREYFNLFRARAAWGRTFSAEEDKPDGPHVAVISDGLWRRRFGGDAQLIGKSIEIGGVPYEVTGVLGADPPWDPPVDVWLPLQVDLNSTGPTHEYNGAARLKPGISLQQANAAMKVAFEGFLRKFPDPLVFPGAGLRVERLQDVVVKDVRASLRLLLGTTVFVLLIACTNVANLLLARGSARGHEIAIRAALSAGRGRIIRQLLTESALLSMAGVVLGLAIGYLGLQVLFLKYPGNIPRMGEYGSGITIDWRLIAFALAVGTLVTAVYALIPAIHGSRIDLNGTLKTGSSRIGTGTRQTRARSLLVMTEIALAIVLLVGSALLIRTYIVLHSVKPGFDGHNVLALDMTLDAPRFQKAAEVARVAQAGTQAVEALPGVEAAATTWSVPLEPARDVQFFTIEGRPLAGKPYHFPGNWRIVTRHYFEVFRIPVVRGRSFTDHDDASGVPVAIINQTLARRFWPDGSNPLGKQIWVDKGLGKGFEEHRPRLVVGIAGDVKEDGLDAKTYPMMYVPVTQIQDDVMAAYSQAYRLMWVVRAKTEPFLLSQQIQSDLRKASSGLPMGHIRSMDQVRVQSTARSDFTASLFTVFAGLALLMAAIGIYGVMAYSVEQRRREIGIRIAVGASQPTVLRLILRDGALLTIVGTVVGISSALVLTRLLSGFLFGVSAWDPIAFVAAVALLGLIALLAAYLPSRTAMRVDPIVALRYE